MFNEFSKFRRRLLSQQESESLLDGDSLSAVFVFRRKSKIYHFKKGHQTIFTSPGRMGAKSWISHGIHLSHGVNPFVAIVHVVHHIHLDRFFSLVSVNKEKLIIISSFKIISKQHSTTRYRMITASMEFQCNIPVLWRSPSTTCLVNIFVLEAEADCRVVVPHSSSRSGWASCGQASKLSVWLSVSGVEGAEASTDIMAWVTTSPEK